MIHLHYETFNISAQAASQMGLDSTQMIKMKFTSNKTTVRLQTVDFNQFKAIIKPLLLQIPSSKRKYDSITNIWTIPADKFDPIRILTEHYSSGLPTTHKHKSLTDFLNQQKDQPKQTSWTEKLRESESFKSTVEAPEDFFKYNTQSLTAVMPETEIKEKLKILILPFVTFELNEREDFMRGYKIAARRLHPDVKGGDKDKMSELNSLWMQYKEIGA